MTYYKGLVLQWEVARAWFARFLFIFIRRIRSWPSSQQRAIFERAIFA
jgi:hypothetical protein